MFSPVQIVGSLLSTGTTHSSMDTSRTNAANKRLRKGSCRNGRRRKKGQRVQVSRDTSVKRMTLVENSITCVSEIIPERICEDSSPVKSTKSPKQEEKNDIKHGRQSDVPSRSLRNEFSSCNLSPLKLSKVKTTRQLLEELQAKKDPQNQFLKLCDFGTESGSLSSKTSRNEFASSNELLRSKSELMERFLSSTPESPSKGDDLPSLCLPEGNRDSSSVSNDLSVESSVVAPDKEDEPCIDPVSEEIKQILSKLPPIDPDEIDWNDDYEDYALQTCERRNVTDADVDRYSQHWEFVNGTYRFDGSWRPWEECTESEVLPEETIRILPYVNID